MKSYIDPPQFNGTKHYTEYKTRFVQGTNMSSTIDRDGIILNLKLGLCYTEEMT